MEQTALGQRRQGWFHLAIAQRLQGQAVVVVAAVEVRVLRIPGLDPGTPGEDSYQKEGPRIAILPFVAEMFGQTTDTRRYVYLSDGGHFENLGIYEMVRRRCRIIVVSDAGADPKCTLEDLGNAVRKVYIDLGVKIEFRRIHVQKRSEVQSRLSTAT